jgi:hypothetical protein
LTVPGFEEFPHDSYFDVIKRIERFIRMKMRTDIMSCDMDGVS